MDTPHLTTPRLRIWRDNDSPPFEVQATNTDLVMWDRTRAKKRWPKTDEAPFLWMTFLAWSVSRRTGAIPAEVGYEDFEASTVAIEAIDEDGRSLTEGEQGVVAVPTNEAAEPD